MKKRAKLTAVYMTDADAGMVWSALDLLCDQLQPMVEQHNGLSMPTKWARRVSRNKLLELMDLFVRDES